MKHRVRLGGFVVLAALALAACGSSSGGGKTSATTSRSAATSSAKFASLVPSSIKNQGFIVVGASAYDPAIFQSASGQWTGWEVDLLNAELPYLGITAHYVPVQLTGLLTGLASGRINLGVSDLDVTPAREKVVTFVTNHYDTNSFMVSASSSIKSLNGLASLCGRSIAVETGSVEAFSVQDEQKKCSASGRPAMNIQTYEEQAQANLALETGRAQVDVGATDSLAYTIQTAPGKFKLVGGYPPKTLGGVAVAKSADGLQLARALQAATNAIIKNGTFGRIIAKWHETPGTVDKSLIVPAP